MKSHRSDETRHSSLNTFFVLLFLLLFVPLFADAAVLINEIAWMGTTVSANDEWIELYNNGSVNVDLEGWELSDNVSLSIPLSGIISSGAYFLLERTDDESVPEKTADLIYTGALGNDGRTLTLYRSDSSVEDQVAGGETWEAIGGDNVSKDTAQLTQSGWITAAPTPKAKNSVVSAPLSVSDDQDDDESDTDSKSNSKNMKISLTPSGRVLTLDLGNKRVVYVNQTVEFEATPHGMSDQLVESLEYTWNFGDGQTGGGKETQHTYGFPGTYVAVAEAHHASFEDEGRVEVTVLPTSLELAVNEDGNILIHNNGVREIDVSQYTLRDGATAFMFPSRSIILSRATLTIPPRMFKKSSLAYETALSDARGAVVASLNGRTTELAEARPRTVAAVQPVSEGTASVEDIRRPTVVEAGSGALPAVAQNTDTQEPAAPSNLAAAVEALPQPNTNRVPFAALIGVITLGVLALYAQRVT